MNVTQFAHLCAGKMTAAPLILEPMALSGPKDPGGYTFRQQLWDYFERHKSGRLPRIVPCHVDTQIAQLYGSVCSANAWTPECGVPSGPGGSTVGVPR